jgi:negative regulator of replication initiation
MAKTLGRNVRISEDLWKTAMSKADRSGETVSDVVRRALETYTDIATPSPDRVTSAAELKLAKIRELMGCA